MFGGYFTLRNKSKLTAAELDQTIAVLGLLDCRPLAQATVYVASTEIYEYKIRFLGTVVDSWGHTTIVLQTDQEPSTEALAYGVESARSHGTMVRFSPAYSKQSVGHIEGANGLASGLLRPYKLKLERRLGEEIRPDRHMVPFLVNAVGWNITRFQPRAHGGSLYKFLTGREYAGEVAEMGE